MRFAKSLDWYAYAACATTGLDREAFFALDDRSETANELERELAAAAMRLCEGCRVRSDCLEEAIEGEERFGIWGGLLAAERIGLAQRVGAARRLGRPLRPLIESITANPTSASRLVGGGQ